jgi:hypothetical protein
VGNTERKNLVKAVRPSLNTARDNKHGRTITPERNRQHTDTVARVSAVTPAATAARTAPATNAVTIGCPA